MNRPTLGAFLRYLLCSPRCVVCRRPLGADQALRGTSGCDVLCPACRAKWEQEKLEVCPACGRAMLDCRCMPAQPAEAGAETLLSLGAYRADGAIGRLILYLKDHRSRSTADFAAAQLCHAIRTAAASLNCPPEALCVTFLPRSRRARRRCGHDQAELLARAIAARLGAEFRPLLARRRDSRAQKSLSGAARMANVAEAFSPCDADCRGRTVLLVDDIVTTGASLAAGTKILREMGAACVICAVIGVSARR